MNAWGKRIAEKLNPTIEYYFNHKLLTEENFQDALKYTSQGLGFMTWELFMDDGRGGRSIPASIHLCNPMNAEDLKKSREEYYAKKKN